MSRDFAALSRGPSGIFVPRWMIISIVGVLAALLVYSAFAPPTWTIQRLESPDGNRTAVLSRAQLGRQHFVIKVKDGVVWRTLLVSPPITNSFREDLGERLSWSSNSATLFFRMQNETVWKHDFQ